MLCAYGANRELIGERMSVCQICGSTNLVVRCFIEDLLINNTEVVFRGDTPVVESVPMYCNECLDCGCLEADNTTLQINRASYIMLRRQHGLSDTQSIYRGKDQ